MAKECTIENSNVVVLEIIIIIHNNAHFSINRYMVVVCLCDTYIKEYKTEEIHKMFLN